MAGTNDAGGNLTKIEKSASILSVPKFHEDWNVTQNRMELNHGREEYYSGRKWTLTINKRPPAV